MPNYREYINALRQCAKEHEKEVLSTFNINTSKLCNDTANLLEELEMAVDALNKKISELEGKKCQEKKHYIT